jgi:hypothetical protein
MCHAGLCRSKFANFAKLSNLPISVPMFGTVYAANDVI